MHGMMKERTRGRRPWNAKAIGVSLVGLIAAGCVILPASAGCVRRTITISTDPPNALVYLNDQEIGRSTVTMDFLWYGDYDVVIRHDDCETLQTNMKIKPPWYQVIPLDFFVEVFYPRTVHDVHHRHFVLEPRKAPAAEEVIERAIETRERAQGPG